MSAERAREASAERRARDIFNAMSHADRHGWMDLAVLDSTSAAHAEYFPDEPREVRRVLSRLIESWEQAL